MTANMREWRHFLRLRCSLAAHPQMREVAIMLAEKLHEAVPVIFDDIYAEVMAYGTKNTAK
jgi:thymidylate synthase (FAD)